MEILKKVKRFVNYFLQIPYCIMTGYANNQQETASDFSKMYANVVFLALAMMLVTAYVGWTVDYSVLYGIEYNSTQDAASADWQAFQSATIIQLLILVFFGIAAKALIFGKAFKHRGHFLMFGLATTLFIYGFSWTLQLSNQTYHSAKANATQTISKTKAEFAANGQKLAEEKQNELLALANTIQAQKKAESAKYQPEIDRIENKYADKVTRKEVNYKKGNISKLTLIDKTAKYNSAKDAEQKKPNDALNTALLLLTNQEAKQAAAINAKYDSLSNQNNQALAAALLLIEQDIEANAKATQGRNITINITSVLLQLLTIIFALFATKDNGDTSTDATSSTDEPNSGNSRNKKKKKTSTNKAKMTVEASNIKRKKTPKPASTPFHNVPQPQTVETSTGDSATISTVPTVETKIQTVEGFEIITVEGRKPKIMHNGTPVLASKLKGWAKTTRTRINKYIKNGQTELVAAQKAMIADYENKIKILEKVE